MITAVHRSRQRTYNYYAIKGLDFNPGNVRALVSLHRQSRLDPHREQHLRYTAVGTRHRRFSAFRRRKAHRPQDSVIRTWNTGGRSGGLYVAGYVGPTRRGQVFYHCGWKIGANRDDDPSVGGATVFSHLTIFRPTRPAQSFAATSRPTAPATAASRAATSVFTENLFIDNPAAIGVGGGPSYNTDRPTGVTFDVSYNAIIGDADVNSVIPSAGPSTRPTGSPAAASTTI